MEKRSWDFLYALTNAQSRKEKQEVRYFMQRERVLKGFRHVAYHGAPEAARDHCNFDNSSHVLNVYISPIEPEIKDNALIEEYLENTFGSYTPFIKKYLAAYTYTNHTTLPTLVFYGPRGTSKTTAAMLIADIYHSLYTDWDMGEGQFSPEAEKKLAIIEENDMISKKQYKTLKKYSGASHITVNKKYKPEYQVKNNLNMILISNEEVPLYVETGESPTSELNNQFFVYRFDPLEGAPNPNLRQELKKRLGHYVQTELKQVFSRLDMSQGRYGIPVPITKWEQQLFENNKTTLADLAEDVLLQIENGYRKSKELSQADYNFQSQFQGSGLKLLDDDFLAVKTIKRCNLEGNSSRSVTRQLKKMNVITGKCRRKYTNGDAFRGYSINEWPELRELQPPSEDDDIFD